MSLRPAIGLEVHAQLDTASKLFCRCKNSPLDRPNSNTCPICLGLPGSLPSFNGKVLELAASVGLALNCRVNQISQFARKNYLYPDLPKGYQITQFEKPICEDGYVELKGARVRVRRVHIEEDSGKIVHSKDGSLIDFNRAGVPLVEVVTEPDINSASDAIEYLKSLRLALIYLGVCSGDMESGHFRCEANVSVGYKERSFGVPVELKNINSFKVVKKAIEYEIERQCKTIETGGTVLLETRGWDDSKGQTFRMRSKVNRLLTRTSPTCTPSLNLL